MERNISLCCPLGFKAQPYFEQWQREKSQEVSVKFQSKDKEERILKI